jgi:hypothetical protein
MAANKDSIHEVQEMQDRNGSDNEGQKPLEMKGGTAQGNKAHESPPVPAQCTDISIVDAQDMARMGRQQELRVSTPSALQRVLEWAFS